MVADCLACFYTAKVAGRAGSLFLRRSPLLAGPTQNGTWFIGGGHRHTWQHDRIRYLAGAGYANVNLDIYSGDTGDFSHAKPVQTQTKGVAALQKLLFRLGDTPVFLGASQVYARADVSTDNPRLNRVWQQVLGQNSTSSALGVVADSMSVRVYNYT